jgi:hypothetical protein
MFCRRILKRALIAARDFRSSLMLWSIPSLVHFTGGEAAQSLPVTDFERHPKGDNYSNQHQGKKEICSSLGKRELFLDLGIPVDENLLLAKRLTHFIGHRSQVNRRMEPDDRAVKRRPAIGFTPMIFVLPAQCWIRTKIRV